MNHMIEFSFLKWDSQQLGVPSGIIDCLSMKNFNSLENAQSILEEIQSQKSIEFVTIKLPGDCLNVVNHLVRRGAKIMDSELLFRYEDTADKEENKVQDRKDGFQVKFLKKYSHPQNVFAELAKSMKLSRFFCDDNIPFELALKLWETSIINHCEGFSDELAVCMVNNEPAGLVTLRFKDNSRLYLHIVGVLEAFRGKGVAKSMLSAVTSKHSHQHQIYVETQAVNYPAQKAYRKAGFAFENLNYILHLWKSEII